MDAAPHSEQEAVPLLRGVLHAVSCPVTLIVGGVLAWHAPSPRAAMALMVMAIGFAAIFGVSGLYHRVAWSPVWRRRARTADHSMIFVGMATTFTAIWLVALDGWIADVVLGYCWIATGVGVVLKIWFLDARPARHWLGYVGFALVAVVVLPELWGSIGPEGVLLMLAGGVAFAAGGAAYAAGWPNLHPRWFGHHELFHAGTVIGCALYLGALANFTFS